MLDEAKFGCCDQILLYLRHQGAPRFLPVMRQTQESAIPNAHVDKKLAKSRINPNRRSLMKQFAPLRSRRPVAQGWQGGRRGQKYRGLQIQKQPEDFVEVVKRLRQYLRS